MQNQNNNKEDDKSPEDFPPFEVPRPPQQISEGDKPKSMLGRLDRMEESLNTLTGLQPNKLDRKAFKFPSFVKRQTRNLKKMMERNRVQVLLLKISGGIQPTMGEISMGRLIVGDFYWNAADDIIWQWMGKTPTALACEWDMQPLTKKRLMEDTNKLKTWLHPQTIIMRVIKAKQAEEGKSGFKFSAMTWIIIGIILLAGYWLFFGGSGA